LVLNYSKRLCKILWSFWLLRCERLCASSYGFHYRFYFSYYVFSRHVFTSFVSYPLSSIHVFHSILLSSLRILRGVLCSLLRVLRRILPLLLSRVLRSLLYLLTHLLLFRLLSFFLPVLYLLRIVSHLYDPKPPVRNVQLRHVRNTV
jgi:hypothetical protein